MKAPRQPKDNDPIHRYTHERRLLVQQLDREIVLPLEGQCLLASCLGIRGEDRGGDGLGSPSFLWFGSIRRLDIVHVDVGDLDILGLELAAETSTMKTGTKDSSFIGIHVDRHLALSDSGLHGLLDHGRSGGPASEDDRRDVFLKKEMS